ncbi:MAG: chemotaxis protein CheW [Pseudomonadota bacterium]
MSSAHTQAADSTIQVEDDMDQYLTFMLDGEEYGVDILRVQEIKGWDGVTPLPNMPEFILGVINLRGTVVPIVDLRRHFGLEPVPYGKTTVVIVVRIRAAEQGERTMGMVVDAVSEVHNISDSELKPAPDFGGSISTDSIRGLATVNERMIILLDIDHLMNNHVLKILSEASA